MTLSLLAAVLAAAFAAVVGARWWRGRRPAFAAWATGLLVFAVAAAAQAAGERSGLTVVEFRLFYLFGGLLGVAYLGLGTVHLVASPRVAHASTLALLALTVVSAVAMALVPVDTAQLDSGAGALGDALKAPWSAPVRALAAILNTAGTVALVGGSACSAWRLRHDREGVDRLVCNVMITAGALVIAAGLTAARVEPGAAGGLRLLGAYEAVGMAIMFAGFLTLGRLGPRRNPGVPLDA